MGGQDAWKPYLVQYIDLERDRGRGLKSLDTPWQLGRTGQVDRSLWQVLTGTSGIWTVGLYPELWCQQTELESWVWLELR